MEIFSREPKKREVRIEVKCKMVHHHITIRIQLNEQTHTYSIIVCFSQNSNEEICECYRHLSRKNRFQCNFHCRKFIKTHFHILNLVSLCRSSVWIFLFQFNKKKHQRQELDFEMMKPTFYRSTLTLYAQKNGRYLMVSIFAIPIKKVLIYLWATKIEILKSNK